MLSFTYSQAFLTTKQDLNEIITRNSDSHSVLHTLHAPLTLLPRLKTHTLHLCYFICFQESGYYTSQQNSSSFIFLAMSHQDSSSQQFQRTNQTRHEQQEYRKLYTMNQALLLGASCI